MAEKIVLVDGVPYPVAPMKPPVAQMPFDPVAGTTHSAYMAFTPDVAWAWLQHNHLNRNKRKRHAGSQGRDMEQENWDVNGETVKVSRPVLRGEFEDYPEGKTVLLDGQHRLGACHSSGKPFVSLVAWGLKPEVRRTVDTGTARSLSDTLKMNGYKFGSTLATTTRRMLLWDLGDRVMSNNLKPTRMECADYFAKNEDELIRATEQGQWVYARFRHIPPTVLAQGWCLANRASPEEAPWFFSRVADGAELSLRHPVLVLRQRFTDAAGTERFTTRQQLTLVLRSWNHYRANETVAYLKASDDDVLPDPK